MVEYLKKTLYKNTLSDINKFILIIKLYIKFGNLY